jgi:hypothetical protein
MSAVISQSGIWITPERFWGENTPQYQGSGSGFHLKAFEERDPDYDMSVLQVVAIFL